MKTSFSTLACPQWSFQQILDAATQYGFDGVELRVVSGELDLWRLPVFQSGALAATRRCVQELGLQVVALGSSACFHSPHPAERARNIDAALRMAELAEGLGAHAVRVFPDSIQPGQTRADTTGWIIDSLDRLADKLASTGVRVWLETHSDFAQPSAVNDILQGIRRSDIGIIWDPANAFAQTNEVPALSAEMIAHLRHVHVKDLRRHGADIEYVLTGEGQFPFPAFFAELARASYNGFVSFEWEKQWHPELPPAEVALPNFMQWWKAR